MEKNKKLSVETKNIVFCVNQKFIKFLIVAIKSYVYHNLSKTEIYILESDLSTKNKNDILKYKNDKINIIFIHIDKKMFNDLPEMGHLKVEAYFRFLIPKLLQIDKVLYLDCDVLILKDISALFSLDIDSVPLAAAIDPGFDLHKKLQISENQKYFNSGVMLLNLKNIRENKTMEKAFEFATKNKSILTYADQCALNSIINGKFKELNSEYNFQTINFKSQTTNKTPFIIHFTGSLKPTHYLCNHPYKNTFLHYLKNTKYIYIIIFENFMRRVFKTLYIYNLINFAKK